MHYQVFHLLKVLILVQIDNECILFGQVLLVLILFDEGLVGLLLHHMLKARCVSYNFRYTTLFLMKNGLCLYQHQVQRYRI